MKSKEASKRAREGTISIRSVADRAGVSIATVSRVINAPDVVSASTAKRVREAIDTLGYRPNPFAQGLLTKRSRVIGVSLPDIHGEFYSALMQALDERACKLGYHLLVRSNAHRVDDRSANDFVLDLVDGLIVMLTERSDNDFDAIARINQPMVVIGLDEPTLEVETIACDNTKGATQATTHLLDGTPADRCYFVGAHRGNIDSDERHLAFVDTLRRHGHEVTRDQAYFGEFSFDCGWDWATRMIAEKRLCGASVFAANDEIAIGIANAARDSQISIPDELRIIGFDDSRLCRLLRPRLTSVRVPVNEIGVQAVNALVRQLTQPDTPPQHMTLETTLIVRESSRTPR